MRFAELAANAAAEERRYAFEANGSRHLPVEEWDLDQHSNAPRLDDLPTSQAGPEFAAPVRRDPFWTSPRRDAWSSVGPEFTSDSDNSEAATASTGTTSTATAPGSTHTDQAQPDAPKPSPSALIETHSYTEAIALLAVRKPDDRLLSLLGALHSYRCMTTAQLAALTGDRFMASSATEALRLAHCSGIVETRQDTEDDLRWTPGNTQVRIGRTKCGFQRLLAPHLSWPELHWVTGGLTWLPTLGHDYHDLAIAELLLRAAEYCDVIGVAGERHSGLRALIGAPSTRATHGGRTHRQQPTKARFDGTVIREDGLRICIEVTASKGRKLTGKIHRIIQQLSATRLSQNGVVVLFVVVPPAGLMKTKKNPLRSHVCRRITQVLASTPNAHDVAQRIAVVSLREWFPGPHRVHPERFTRMRAWRPTQWNQTEALHWTPVDLLDRSQLSFWPEPGFDPFLLATELSHLAQTPHWLRERQGQLPRWLDLLNSPYALPLLDAFTDLLDPLDPTTRHLTTSIQAVGAPRRLQDRGGIVTPARAAVDIGAALALRRLPWWPQVPAARPSPHSPGPSLLLEPWVLPGDGPSTRTTSARRAALRAAIDSIVSVARASDPSDWWPAHTAALETCEVLAEHYRVPLHEVKPAAQRALEHAIKTGCDPIAVWNQHHPYIAQQHHDLHRGVQQRQALLLLDEKAMLEILLNFYPPEEHARVHTFVAWRRLGLGEFLAEVRRTNDPNLNAIELHRLLTHTPELRRNADDIVAAFTRRLAPEKAPAVITLGWVLDRRKRGRRLLCLLDAIRAQTPSRFPATRLHENPPQRRPR